jgi:hypothetical protein
MIFIDLLLKINMFSDLIFKLNINRTDGRESPILTESDDHSSDKPRVKYGELVILG